MLSKYFNRRNMIAVVLAAVAARVLLTLLPSYKVDMPGYMAWGQYLAQYGPKNFYDTFHVVYAPFYMYLLWFSGIISNLFSFSQPVYEYFIKLWSVASDFLGGYLIYRIGCMYNKNERGFVAGIIYSLNPAIFFNSSVWGQFDSIPATMLAGVVYFFNKGKKLEAAFLFALSIMTKPQSAILLPLFVVLYFKDFDISKAGIPREMKKLGFVLAGGLLIYSVLSFPFSDRKGFFWIADLYLKSGGDYPYATANAFNLWTLLHGQAVDDKNGFLLLTYGLWSIILLLVSWLFCVYLLIKRPKSVNMLYFSSMLICFSSFVVGSRMHERYLLMSVIFMFICMVLDNKLVIPGVLLSVCVLANHWYIYYMSIKDTFWISPNDAFAYIFALLTVSLLIWCIIYGLKKTTVQSYNGKARSAR